MLHTVEFKHQLSEFSRVLSAQYLEQIKVCGNSLALADPEHCHDGISSNQFVLFQYAIREARCNTEVALQLRIAGYHKR